MRSARRLQAIIESTDAVIDYADLNSPALLLQQQIRELPPYFVVFDDVGFQVDMVPGFADCGKHCRVDSRSVLQQGDFVSQDERAADDCLFQRNLLFQYIYVAGFALELREDSGAFLRGKRTTRIFESGCLPSVPLHQGIGVRQGRATCRGEQAKRRHRSKLKRANYHGSPATKDGVSSRAASVIIAPPLYVPYPMLCGTQRAGGEAGTTITVSPPVLPR